MNPRSWVTAARDAFRSMTHSPLMSLASAATVAVSLLVLSVVTLLAVNLQFMASSVESQVQIQAYLCSTQVPNNACPKTELTDAQKKAAVDQVAKLPGVKSAVFVSKEQALADMKKEFGEHSDILNDLDSNPLRDAIQVTPLDANNIKSVASAVGKVSGVSDVKYGQEYVDKLLTFTNAVRVAGAGLVLMLIVATVLTLSNTIRLAVYARRREVAIMKLVGATDWYIRRPFMMEGIFLGVFGAALAMGLTSIGYQRLVDYVHGSIPFLPIRSAASVLVGQTLAIVVLGGLLGAAGSYVSLRRFLKV
ncbi:MAG: permease-like cell division protein FtsX [Mycobacterium leprae]